MSASQGITGDLRKLAKWAALLPLLSFNVCYLVAAGLDHVPQCIPYITGCTSASSAGRLPPESWLFKTGMLPLVAVLYLLWRGLAAGLDARAAATVLRLLALAVAASLLLYVLTLGIAGPEWRSVRRVGIDGFALGNFGAQLVYLAASRPPPGMRARHRGLFLLCLTAPAMVIAAEIAKALGVPRHPVNNVAAWNALLVQSAWFWLLGQFIARSGKPEQRGGIRG